MKFFKNIKWLITNAPTNIREDTEKRKCDYCDNTKGWTHYTDTGMTICYKCFKRLADKVLTKDNPIIEE